MKRKIMKRKKELWLSFFLSFFLTQSFANNVDIKIAFLVENMPVQPALSNLDPALTDEGIQGAVLGVKDNNTTGLFTGHSYQLKTVEVPVGGDVQRMFDALLNEGYQYVIVDVQTSMIKNLSAKAEKKDVLLFNVSSTASELRNSGCSSHLFHLIPSEAMKADALAQWMLKKRWTDWLLIKGRDAEDNEATKALKRSAKRFGIKIVEEKTWNFDHDARRTAQKDIPVFTQGMEYDVLAVADVKGLFGEYLTMNTWLPRPVIGTQGLVPRAWHRTHERWGAVQMQNRFYKQAGRWMNDVDYASWLAVRAIGEAVTRTNSINLHEIKDYLLSEQFSLAGFKGVKLTFRKWNHQLRQPILLATPRSMVSVLPHKEFLHPRTYLDTLGYDKPESNCTF